MTVKRGRGRPKLLEHQKKKPSPRPLLAPKKIQKFKETYDLTWVEFPYDPEIGKKICEIISTCTDGLAAICKKNPAFPSRETINTWRITHPDFGESYATAKRIQADLLAEEIVDIADDNKNDFIENENGRLVVCNDAINRSRLRIDARKWIACKLLPKVYGDRLTTENDLTVKHEVAIKDLK